MNFVEIGKKLAALGLPLLANAIIPGGGAVVSLVASALGLTDSTPDAIAQALQTNPDAAIRLKEIEVKHAERLGELALQGRQAELAAETAQQASINKTMQVEYKTDNGFKSGWRPMLGWVISFGIGGILLALVNAMFKNPELADKIIASATVIITIALAVLGVNIRARSQDKQAMIPGRPLGIMEALATKLAK